MVAAMPVTETHNGHFASHLRVKEGAAICGTSIQWLYARLRGPNPPPHKKRGNRYLLPKAEFIKWADRDIIE